MWVHEQVRSAEALLFAEITTPTGSSCFREECVIAPDERPYGDSMRRRADESRGGIEELGADVLHLLLSISKKAPAAIGASFDQPHVIAEMRQRETKKNTSDESTVKAKVFVRSSDISL